MMKDIKNELIYKYELVLNSFKDQFIKYDYNENSLFYSRLLDVGPFIPNLPHIESEWINPNRKRGIRINIYNNYVVFVKIINSEISETIHLDQYCKNKFKKDVGVYYMNENTLEGKFIAYLNFLKEVILTDFSEVIAGNTWISIPFDWQGQK